MTAEMTQEPVARYRQKVGEVEAIQLTHESGPGIWEWASARPTYGDDNFVNGLKVYGPGGDGARAGFGDWIVRFPAGTFRVIPAEKFAEAFEPAVDAKPASIGVTVTAAADKALTEAIAAKAFDIACDTDGETHTIGGQHWWGWATGIVLLAIGEHARIVPKEPAGTGPADSRKVQGCCPSGCGETLMLADGGYVTCMSLRCPRPDAAADILADSESGHVVELGQAAFTIRHPLRERLDDALMACSLHEHLSGLDGPPAAPGRYRVTGETGNLAWEAIEHG